MSVPKNCVTFIGCNFRSRASQVGLRKQKKDTASAKKGIVSFLRSGTSATPNWCWVSCAINKRVFFEIKVQPLTTKTLQRTANEYAEERRIYKDLISKNNNVDILNSARRILQLEVILAGNRTATGVL